MKKNSIFVGISLVTFLVSCNKSKTEGNNDAKAIDSISVQKESIVKEKKEIGFESYTISAMFNGEKPKALDLKSNPNGEKYKSILTDAFRKAEINFAAKYSLVSWGCGSPCETGVLVDWTDGKLYDLPESAYGYSMDKKSYLLIVNPKDPNPDNAKFQQFPETYFTWNEAEKKFEEIK